MWCVYVCFVLLECEVVLKAELWVVLGLGVGCARPWGGLC